MVVAAKEKARPPEGRAKWSQCHPACGVGWASNAAQTFRPTKMRSQPGTILSADGSGVHWASAPGAGSQQLRLSGPRWTLTNPLHSGWVFGCTGLIVERQVGGVKSPTSREAIEWSGPVEDITVVGDYLVAILSSGYDDAVGRVIVKVGQGNGTSGDCAVNRNFNEPRVRQVLTPLQSSNV